MFSSTSFVPGLPLQDSQPARSKDFRSWLALPQAAGQTCCSRKVKSRPSAGEQGGSSFLDSRPRVWRDSAQNGAYHPLRFATYLLVDAGAFVPPASDDGLLSHPTNAKQATNANNATSLIVYFFVCSFCRPPARAGWRLGESFANPAFRAKSYFLPCSA